ncbi:hypothetical protein AQI88_33645 [Streptomyces cellostaticus]|uniref:Uncharacterized protein n=1 Tax=Streptomyces cellostaticus TaxID=67285 RepID=A0A101NFG7_9ACTN|nr:hypothetical protein AQI88_33645 [Streptomyces cellostaticus]
MIACSRQTRAEFITRLLLTAQQAAIGHGDLGAAYAGPPLPSPQHKAKFVHAWTPYSADRPSRLLRQTKPRSLASDSWKALQVDGVTCRDGPVGCLESRMATVVGMLVAISTHSRSGLL